MKNKLLVNDKFLNSLDKLVQGSVENDEAIFKYAINKLDIDKIKECLKSNIDKNYFNSDSGDLLIRHIILNGRFDILKLLFHSFDIDIYESSLLYYSTVFDKKEIFNYLIDLDNGNKWNCSNCIVRSTCCELCENYIKKDK